ncbi:diguanylate cyclase domain-containing protein [Roseateles paludis]|jgi:diguanylate cyclase (GGDEF)-like protein/PAS domain S-box-containing protein|uniref:Diguanylate cyclase n=1 Tax=Roseateles paludis TaxID=3145238 RepID=A0ABV0G5N0_9BURK
MQLLSRGGLQRRLLVAVLSVATLLCAVVGVIGYEWAYQRVDQSSQSTLEALARAVERPLAFAVHSGDTALVEEILEGLARHELLTGVEVRTPVGNLVAQYPRDRANSATEASSLFVTRRLASPTAVRQSAGTLTLEANTQRVTELAARQAWMVSALLGSQVLVLAVVLYFAAQRLVSQPIVKLSDRLRQITPGGTRRLRKPSRHSQDEIGQLIDSANALIIASETALASERRIGIRMAELEAQFREIFESSRAGIFLLDTSLRLVTCNPAAAHLLGHVAEAQSGDEAAPPFIDLVFARPTRVREILERAKTSGGTATVDLELARQDGQGTEPTQSAPRWVHCTFSLRQGTGADERIAVEGVIFDITERKQAERTARYQSQHDPLTGLKNRVGTLKRASQHLAEAQLQRGSLSVLCIDLDGFKAVNDSYGHQAGDEVLIACAKRMRTVLRRASDLIGRLGGDEFVVVLPGLDVGDEQLAEAATALLTALCEPIALSTGGLARVSACIGAASLWRHGRDVDTLIAAADQAMYAVKQGGKAAVACALADRDAGGDTEVSELELLRRQRAAAALTSTMSVFADSEA